MKIVIIEDEHSAIINLKHLLQQHIPSMDILAEIDTVEDAIDFFSTTKDYDLIFMDIRLADGISFDIFKEVEPAAPIIFTTAYDEYAIQAFKVNSIDYLLKPIGVEGLQNALDKFNKTRQQTSVSNEQISGFLATLQNQQKQYRTSFLVQYRDTLVPISANDFAYFFIQDGVVRGVTTADKQYHLDGKLEDIERDLNPKEFFRANRQYLIQRSAIKDIHFYFNGRLIANIQPVPKEKIIISKANAPKFKQWLKMG
jgi:two-component system LytT family response regulator